MRSGRCVEVNISNVHGMHKLQNITIQLPEIVWLVWYNQFDIKVDWFIIIEKKVILKHQITSHSI